MRLPNGSFFIINILPDLVRCYHGGMNREDVLVILLVAFIVFVFFYPNYGEDNNKAMLLNSGKEKIFKPLDVVWSGKIISIMASGSCIGLEGEFNNYSKAIACFPVASPNELWKFNGTVTVTGKWLGITCAYKNTIFGECVPDVSVENIRQ